MPTPFLKKRNALDEYEAKQLFAAYGLPIAKGMLARTGKDVLEVARLLGYPLALKVCSWKILHKNDKVWLLSMLPMLCS